LASLTSMEKYSDASADLFVPIKASFLVYSDSSQFKILNSFVS